MGRIFFILFFFISVLFVYAEEKRSGYNINVPEGMEVVKFGNSNVIVPKDAIVRKEGGRLFVESADEYVARKTEETRKRLDSVESSQAELKNEIELLKASLAELKKASDKKD